jgi:hypothetical protein
LGESFTFTKRQEKKENNQGRTPNVQSNQFSNPGTQPIASRAHLPFISQQSPTFNPKPSTLNLPYPLQQASQQFIQQPRT